MARIPERAGNRPLETQLIPWPNSGQPDSRVQKRGASLQRPGRTAHMGSHRHCGLPRTGPRTHGSWRASARPICFVIVSKHSCKTDQRDAPPACPPGSRALPHMCAGGQWDRRPGVQGELSRRPQTAHKAWQVQGAARPHTAREVGKSHGPTTLPAIIEVRTWGVPGAGGTTEVSL